MRWKNWSKFLERLETDVCGKIFREMYPIELWF